MSFLTIPSLLLLAAGANVASANGIKPLGPLTATASSSLKNGPASLAVDGICSDPSRWLGGPDRDGAIWLELKLSSHQKIAGAHLYSGYEGGDPIQNFSMARRNPDGTWSTIPGSEVLNNSETALSIQFDPKEVIETDAVRLVVTKTPNDIARIREVTLWPAGTDLPKLGTGVKIPDPAKTVIATPDEDIPRIYLNQTGFNLGKPKRFTAPLLEDGTSFQIRPAAGGAPVFSGIIHAHIGDFSAFDPDDAGPYVVAAGEETSVPFTIGLWQFERVCYAAAVNFMVDSRHYVGNYKRACQGSYAWRDDHHFSWLLRTLVPQLLSNPGAYSNLPRQITYEKPKPGLWGVLEPYDEAAPDIVKMIHWGADVMVTQRTTHELFKADLAWFLYAWPVLKPWLPQQNHDAVLRFVHETWEHSGIDKEYPYDASTDHNLFALKTVVGSTKGELPPGFNVLPHLLMHQVALREGLPDADRYLKAAFAQVEWIIKELDWDNPQTTKGQRMSEHVTITGLAACLQMHPQNSPKGLREKINEWARVMVRRSDNLWDFRKLDDGDKWVPWDSHPHKWNEPGNVVGFPAIALAATPFVDDSKVRERLHQLVWSHLDNCFGRNPCGRHFSYDAPRELEGVEHGWHNYHRGGVGQLSQVRFVLDGSPKQQHYPYHPEIGSVGHTEGWVAFNTAFNLSLAYMARYDSRLELSQQGDALSIRLRAPVNFDFTRNEPVTVTLHNGKEIPVMLVEAEPGSDTHTGGIRLASHGLKPGDTIKTSYGFGYMGTHAELRLMPMAEASPGK